MAVVGLQSATLATRTSLIKQTRTQLCHSNLRLKLDGYHWIGAFRAFSSNSDKTSVRILEVGPRDGLQNIKQSIPTTTKVELIKRLAGTGLRNIEATSFVSPKWVPQLADGSEVMKEILPLGKRDSEAEQLHFPVLAPNAKGLQAASKAGAKEIVVFASATEAFSKSNQNCTVDQALAHAQSVTETALKENIKVRGVVSCIFADPFSGRTDPLDVLYVVKRLLSMGCYEVSLGDTTGVGTPADTERLLHVLLKEIPAEKLAGHFHDTYGQAIANVVRAYDMGIRTFDSSVAGLGGCPFAAGAKGNVATEDVVYTLEQSGINTGVDLENLISVGQWISQQLDIPYGSRAGAALAARKKTIKSQPAPAHKSSRTWEIIDDTGEYQVSRAETAVKITLTRPKNGNALTDGMVEGLAKLFQDLARDKSVFHIIIAAQGKYFCTGMDLSGKTEISNQSLENTYHSKVVNLYHAIEHAPQTTIALVEGPCFGGGVGMTFACDVRLVSSKAQWTLSEIKLGICPAIISKYLVREMGVSFAREAMLSGRDITPEQLKQIGAVHRVFEGSTSNAAEHVLDEYLDRLRKCAPGSAAMCKELVKIAWQAPETRVQRDLIAQYFANMMGPGSEGEFGISQFRKGLKEVDWATFTKNRTAVS